MKIPVNQIKVGERIRRDLGDLKALADSIRDVGLLHPVVVDSDGHLIAGERRLVACRDLLKWPEIPVTVAKNLDEALRIVAEGHENVQRLNFTAVEAEAWQRKMRPVFEPEAQAAKAKGRPPKGAEPTPDQEGLISSANLAEDSKPKAKRTERESRAKSAKATGYGHATLQKVTKVREVAESHESDEIRAFAASKLTAMDKPGAKVDRLYNDVMREVKKHAAEKAIEEAKSKPVVFPIHHCAITDLDLEPDSVDLIFTDPPYPAEHLPRWSELGELAAKSLKPGGLVVAYTGQVFLPEVMSRLAEHLDYWWCFAVTHVGSFYQLHARSVQVGWKPLLVYRKPGGDRLPWVKDIVTEGSREKSEHYAGGDWQQSEAEAAYWIGKITEPEQLVVDPFVGSGTTAAVCKELGRRFIGCDIDPVAVTKTRERVS